MTDGSDVVAGAADMLSQTLGEAREALAVWEFRTAETDPLRIVEAAQQHAAMLAAHDPDALSMPEKAAGAVHGEAIWAAGIEVLQQAVEFLRHLRAQDLDKAVVYAGALGYARAILAVQIAEPTFELTEKESRKWASAQRLKERFREKDYLEPAQRIRSEQPLLGPWEAAGAIADETGAPDQKAVYRSIRDLWPVNWPSGQG